MIQRAFTLVFLLLATITVKAQSEAETIDWLKSKIRLYAGDSYKRIQFNGTHVSLRNENEGELTTGIEFDLSDIKECDVHSSTIEIWTYGSKIIDYYYFTPDSEPENPPPGYKSLQGCPCLGYQRTSSGKLYLDLSNEPNLRDRFTKAMRALIAFNRNQKTPTNEAY